MQQMIEDAPKKRIPVICLVLEGGTFTIRAVLDYVTKISPIPVIICDGSGRAADLLAFAHQYYQSEGLEPLNASLVTKDAFAVIGFFQNSPGRSHTTTAPTCTESFQLRTITSRKVDH